MIICGILTGLKYYILEYPFDFNLPLAAADVFEAVLGDCSCVFCGCATEENNQMWDTNWVEMLTSCVG